MRICALSPFWVGMARCAIRDAFSSGAILRVAGVHPAIVPPAGTRAGKSQRDFRYQEGQSADATGFFARCGEALGFHGLLLGKPGGIIHVVMRRIPLAECLRCAKVFSVEGVVFDIPARMHVAPFEILNFKSSPPLFCDF